MNIFKILASGDGSINEPNVSAFLGYLINPKEDHGIGDELLKRILRNLYEKNEESSLKDFLVDKYGEMRNLSNHINFEIEVLLEQAFKSEGGEKKEIVDIVILCYEKKNEEKESLAKAILSDNNKGELKQIFLIENKIKDGSAREDQLINQAKSSIDTLKNILKKEPEDIKKIISLIFISPKGEKSRSQFSQLESDSSVNIPKTHIHWNFENRDEEDEDEISIVDYLKEILQHETEGNIEAINEYTKHTIKSFITFIQNDFKSAIEEELEGKKDHKRDISYNLDTFKSEHEDLLNEKSWEIIYDIENRLRQNHKKINIRYSPSHPLSVFTSESNDRANGKKIFSLTRNGRSLLIQLPSAIFKESKDELLKFIKDNGFDIILDKDWGLRIRSQNLGTNKILDIFEKQYSLMK